MMKDERYALLMRDAARTYNPPPDDVPLDEMWTSIERLRVRGDLGAETPRVPGGRPNAAMRGATPPRAVAAGPSLVARRWRPWAQAAAALILGAALGRTSSMVGPGAPPADALRAGARDDATAYDRSVTEEYLGDAAALLIALPAALESQRVDPSFAWRASDLLLQTRLLLDSPERSDPALRALLEDLEVVLVQIVRLGDWDPMKVDLLEQSLERQDVIPRLRSVVVDRFTD